MTAHENEEAELRSAALKNAQAILLARQRAERELTAEREWLRTTLASIGDGVISTDARGRVTFLNEVAETLTGWTRAQARGRPLVEIFRIINERTREPVENPALRALEEGAVVGLANLTVLIARDGTERPIDDSAAPIRDDSGTTVGTVLVFRDVTERKQASENQARLAAIVESSDDAIISKSLDGVIRTWNAGAQRLFGYTADEAVGQAVTLIIPAERQDEEREILERLRRGERIDHFETVRVAKDGRQMHISLTVSPLRDDDGAITGASKVARDITERVEGERALVESRARLEYAVRLSGLGFWYSDLPFGELAWDERTKGHFWLAPDARVTIDTFYERIHPEERAAVRHQIEASIRDRAPYDIDYRTVDPATGAIKWIRAMGAAGYASDGTPVRFDGMTVDVTAQRLERDLLARTLEREQQHGRLLRQVADASLTIHSAGSLESVLQVIAEESRRILGAEQAVCTLTENEDGSQTIAATAASPEYGSQPESCTPPDSAELYREVCRANRTMRLGASALESHPAWRRRDASRPPLRGWLVAPFVGRGGQNLGLIQLCDKRDGDFDERDEAILIPLAHIASVAIQNARLYGELRDQDRRKDEFLALLAHELRNPLAPIRNGLEVLRMAEDRAVRERSQQIMDRQLGHMVRLIDDLLDVSRISRNKMELRWSRVRLADVISSAVETARPLIDAAGHELVLSLPSEPVVLDADLTRLAQVFSNLLTNSAKYTEPGGRIWLSAECRGPAVTVVIRDNGIGIPAAALPTVFDMFSQVDRSIERSAGGLGIGLALVRGLVEMHRGTVTAHSDGPGRGSTFTVRLRTAAPSETPVARAPGAERAGPRRRILVVDDHRDSAASMATMLELAGDEVRTAHDGLEAVTLAESFRPDVILMDVGMPRLNGYEATRRIREQPWGKALTIFALTGWGQEGDRVQSKAAGCDGHLVKPVRLADLRELLAEG